LRSTAETQIPPVKGFCLQQIIWTFHGSRREVYDRPLLPYVFHIPYKLTSSRTPIDPNPDLLTEIRNEASTKIHLLGGKAITAPGEERINDDFRIKPFNAEQEKRNLLLKPGIVTGVAALFWLIDWSIVGGTSWEKRAKTTKILEWQQ
jgi:hypothetical protein